MDAAVRRATTIRLAVTEGITLKAGHFFSIGPHLHVIADVVGGDAYRIEPPLREPAPAGTAANFSTPACQMRLTEDLSGSLTLELSRRGFADFSFVEAI